MSTAQSWNRSERRVGRELARRLAGEGYRVIAVASHEERLHPLTAEVDPGHECVVADLVTADGLERVAELIAEQRVHLLSESGSGERRRAR
ncbi:hypothetical protein ACH47Z_24160 [Streptomyces sp. NPDC020192]|uniref:hypothetical protein n=1 Tax=Streptomyces sp. NPDC020192 TaxID=3365066 RepID=UPI0037972F63